MATLDVMEMSLSPLLTSLLSLLHLPCGDRSDLAAALALLPCENRCNQKSPQMCARGKHVVFDVCPASLLV